MKAAGKWLTLLTVMATLMLSASGQSANTAKKPIVVDPSGKGDHRTIQGAINSLTDSAVAPRVIFIRKGVYHEKLYIEKQHIVLEGEDREKTTITAGIARDEWRCVHQDDWGVATLNVRAEGLTLRNLTVTNSYGFEHEDRVIHCSNDTSADKQKKVNRNSHQMALRAFSGATKLKAVNCRFRSYGGDTVSPWDTESGLWYFRDCIMEGGVDLYCPRGWAWAENCTIIANRGTAAIWHDGSGSTDAKSVLKNCRFEGYDGFMLGRYHREAQIYLVDCRFPANMRDTAIYHVPNSVRLKWGHRIYYSGCSRIGGNDFSWYAENLPAGIDKSNITVAWVFGNRWNPLID